MKYSASDRFFNSSSFLRNTATFLPNSSGNLDSEPENKFITFEKAPDCKTTVTKSPVSITVSPCGIITPEKQLFLVLKYVQVF